MTERLHFHFSLSRVGEGNGNPLQCSCLENPRDGGDWWAAVYGVAQSRTRLKWLSSSSSCRDWILCYCSFRFSTLWREIRVESHCVLQGNWRNRSLDRYFQEPISLFHSFSSVQFSLSIMSLTLCDPMDCSMPGFPVHHQLLELAQAHVHWVGDAIQPSHPLSSPSPPPFNLPSIRVFSNESVLQSIHEYWNNQSFDYTSQALPLLISRKELNPFMVTLAPHD